MNVIVFTPCLVQGDAVSNDVLSMVDALNRAGHNARAAAPTIKNGIDALPFERIASFLQSPNDALIYHHSIGMEEGIQLYESLSCCKIVKYHNITPPRYYESFNKEVERICRLGLEQTSRLLPDCAAFWVDSPFNGREMQEQHPEQPFEVLPPYNQVDELINAEPDLTTVALHDDWLTNILVVGRIVPNKNNMLAVDAFAEYQSRFDSRSRLIFVGDLAQNKYFDCLIDHIRERQLSRHVVITGKVSTRQLKTLFLTAQMLLSTSSHEGFCLPLIEAMELRVPIVAVPNAAIPDTAADAAWYAEATPGAIAEVMHQVRTLPLQREARLNRGWQRRQDFYRNEAIERRLLQLFREATEKWGMAKTSLQSVEANQPSE